MHYLYTLSILLYGLLIRLAAPFNRKARLLVAGRAAWREPFRAKPLDPARPVAWFHAASLGEFEQGRPVIEALRATYPQYQIVLSFFSPSGYEVRKNYAGADVITYLPADTAANAQEWLATVRPQLAFFIKYEFWYHYLHALNEANPAGAGQAVPTISFSAIFRPNQLFFKPWGGFYRKLLTYFRAILVQNQESVDLLRGIGIDAILAGDTRFDRVAQVAANKRDIPEVAAFAADNVPTLVVGSAWAADMAVLIPMINQFSAPLRVIIAPHEIHDADIERWQSQLTAPSVRFSSLTTPPGRGTAPGEVPRYLFIDNIGMLSSLYQYGTMAYIGGAFGKGLHNCLEAATFGLPLLFGPNHRKFQEAVDLVAQGGAFAISNTDELTQAFTRLYENAPTRERAGAICKAYVLDNVGATGKVMGIVDGLALQGMGNGAA
ncbi:3-deoxy-D-manno-octulosonic-acid transferase [Fibrella aestuarina BUZ 2]|uniref:3-deoxy-D-manno-octulosonic acid transferase n=1 Tax=Fibrella aestuarina BUZ 2 TaxID=1166018 RepID=I0K5N2_9BACT|nr:glycosyltransferase N-terminal domain-containing protein [Fibrella aestuarina]CCG99435.1 3-deoxy-D-manno-octulosonic-acid transferase [Fibrella aestuarina BUZ 2]